MKLTQQDITTIQTALTEEKFRLLDFDTVPSKRNPVRSDSPHLQRILKLKVSFENFKTSPGNIYTLSVINNGF